MWVGCVRVVRVDVRSVGDGQHGREFGSGNASDQGHPAGGDGNDSASCNNLAWSNVRFRSGGFGGSFAGACARARETGSANCGASLMQGGSERRLEMGRNQCPTCTRLACLCMCGRVVTLCRPAPPCAEPQPDDGLARDHRPAAAGHVPVRGPGAAEGAAAAAVG